MKSSKSQALVVGAGPTGLMLSLWLRRRGVDVLTIDKGPGLSPESRALGVQARTLETYDMLGLGEDALNRGMRAQAVTAWVDQKARVRVEFESLGEGLSPHPYLFILSQNENEDILYQALQDAGGEVHWNTSLHGFEDLGDRVKVELESGGSSWELETSYLCGCDGASSPTRKGLLGDFPGGTYEGRFFVADVTMPEEFDDSSLGMSITREGILLTFPMAGVGRARLFGNLPDSITDASLAEVESYSQTHFNLSPQQAHWISTYRVHHRVAESFHENRVFLLGDAAHVHSPVGGQGMNTGLLDASNLGWKLAAALKDGADPVILNSYAEERLPFAKTLVNSTDRAFGFLSSNSLITRSLRAKLIPLAFALLKRFDFVRKAMFRTVSQIRIEYRQSSLSQAGDSLAGIKAGDRLPWVEIEDGQGNFKALQSCDWQIHIYGKSPSAADSWQRVPVHRFNFNLMAKKAGLLRDAIYLIRPDGYVAMVLQNFDSESLDAYLAPFGRFNAQ